MGTIREELEESKLSNNGSDKGYFEDDNGYDSQEEEEFRKRQDQLFQGIAQNDDDEDHRSAV